MRHGNKINHLGRKIGHRVALLKNLAAALIEHKRINTTLAKAKELRRFIEPLITKSKDNTTHSRRVIFSYLQNKEALKELFATISPRILTRPGGYVRIIKTGFRSGDAAEMALIELVDFNEVYTKGTKPAAAEAATEKKKRTRRSSGKKAKTAEATTEETAPVETETTKTEA